jgi:hypothetical protein
MLQECFSRLKPVAANARADRPGTSRHRTPQLIGCEHEHHERVVLRPEPNFLGCRVSSGVSAVRRLKGGRTHTLPIYAEQVQVVAVAAVRPGTWHRRSQPALVDRVFLGNEFAVLRTSVESPRLCSGQSGSPPSRPCSAVLQPSTLGLAALSGRAFGTTQNFRAP